MILSQKIRSIIQPVFVSHKIEQDLKAKPTIMNQQFTPSIRTKIPQFFKQREIERKERCKGEGGSRGNLQRIPKEPGAQELKNWEPSNWKPRT